MKYFLQSITLAAIFLFSTILGAAEFADTVEHKFVDSDGVTIHYAKAGSGPLAVFIHGFPDYWYSWRHQMEGLAENYTVVTMDTRGYNRSDQPTGVENYSLELLTADVAAIIENEAREKAVIIGHDWGGVVSPGVLLLLDQTLLAV
jgi:pimeloyl-ACP methyl ester carboxylesterase